MHAFKSSRAASTGHLHLHYLCVIMCQLFEVYITGLLKKTCKVLSANSLNGIFFFIYSHSCLTVLFFFLQVLSSQPLIRFNGKQGVRPFSLPPHLVCPPPPLGFIAVGLLNYNCELLTIIQMIPARNTLTMSRSAEISRHNYNAQIQMDSIIRTLPLWARYYRTFG